jgi:D-inositol-3-phosphate glycosyltransferase
MRIERVALLSLHSSPLARIGSGDAGGMNVYVQQLAEGLARCGIQADMFTRRTDREAPAIVETAGGARLIHLNVGPARPLPKSVLPLHIPAAVQSMRSFMREEGVAYDVLHAHYWLSGLVATRVRDDRTPVVAMFHTLSKVKELYAARTDPTDTALRGDGERCVINHADAIVGATEEEREQIESLYGRAPARFAVIPPGVDLERFSPSGRAESRRALGLEGDRIVLFVGRLDPAKGLDILLHAVSRIRPALGDLRVVVLGHDAETERRPLAAYRRQVVRLGLEQAIEFRGVAPQETLPLYYSAADILAVPSIYESFGMAALEAMACGTPVVGFGTVGLRATVRDGQTGFLARPGDRADFTERLSRALQSEELERMGRQARMAAHRFRWETVTERTIALYEKLMQGSYAFGGLVGAG